MNNLGIDVGKKKCSRAVLKDDKGKILDEFFFGNERNGNTQSAFKNTITWKMRCRFRIHRKHVDENS